MPSVRDDRSLHSPPGPEVVLADGHRHLYFGGTGYLGIQARPELEAAAIDAMGRYGLSPATSRAAFGECPPVAAAEALAARFFGSERAWLVPSGWVGATILLDAFRSLHDRVFVDAGAHYALRDAARVSRAPIVTFDHLDPESLRARLDATLRGGERPIVLTDGVFPVSGRVAPLRDYADALRRHESSLSPLLIVDDAHGFGVLGANGRGTAELDDLLDDPRVLVTGTASKALGGYGGLLPGTAEHIDRLRSRTHWFEGSTPPPAPVAAATAAALRIACEEPQLRVRLARNVARLRDALRGLGLLVDDLPTPIVPIVLSTGSAMRKLHEALRAEQIVVPYLARYAGLGPDGALRIAVFATHEDAHLERLIDALRRHLP